MRVRRKPGKAEADGDRMVGASVAGAADAGGRGGGRRRMRIAEAAAREGTQARRAERAVGRRAVWRVGRAGLL
jgi:hypothetical protein